MHRLVEKLLSGDPRALSRLITRVENRSPDALEVLKTLFPRTGHARVIGVTGSPGAGKSSLVDRLATGYRKQGKTLGIIAVDPSSPFTGGAILGDRIRMQTHGTDPGIFIRSMASRGHPGGLAAATTDVVVLMDAAGRDPIIVETVGAGQDEIDVVKLADVSVVVLVPGMGDDIQALKAGIMEIGDVFVINKCDRLGAEKMERAVLAMLELAHRADGWVPPIVRTVATEGHGIEELAEAIEKCIQFLHNSAFRLGKRRAAARQRLLTLLEERLVEVALQEVFPDGELNAVVDKIAEREQDPYTVVDEIIRGSRLRRME